MTGFARSIWTLLLVFGVAIPAVQAQSLDTGDDPRLEEADAAFKAHRFYKAAELYEEYFNENNTDYLVAYRIGRTYYYMRDSENEIKWYKEARAISNDGNDTLLFDLASALMRNGQYSDAKAMFELFQSRYEKEDEFSKQAVVRKEGCQFALDKANDLPDYAVKLVEGLNEEGTDFAPSPYTVKGDSFMIWTTHRWPDEKKKAKAQKKMNKGKTPKGLYYRIYEPYSDLWISKMTSDSTFESQERMSKKVNTKSNDGNAVVAPDGLTMYYTICGKGKYEKKYGCSIYMSEFNDDAKAWGKYQLVEGINGEQQVVTNTRGKTKTVPTYDSQPTLSADGNTMYFVSTRDGGQGGSDIWYSSKLGNAWATPKNAGSEVNTPFNEITPNLGADGNALYFASDGHPGYGGFDIFRAKGKGSAFETPENLGKALNSSHNEHGIVWLYQDSIGYIASDRPESGLGKYDIYRVNFIYRPPVEITIHGTIRDRDSKEPIAFATAILFEYAVDESNPQDTLLIPVDTFQTDQTAEYEFVLENNKLYKIIGNAPEYLANEVFVSTMNFDKPEMQEKYNAEVGMEIIYDLKQDIDIYLEAITIDAPIVLQNVYFDFDSSNIRMDAQSTLNTLADVLKKNPNITIQMGAHTDSNGSEPYNKALSERRAKSVVGYLTENGISDARLSWFGFGETQPLIYPELSDSDEQANRRVEFRIKSIDYEEEAEDQASK